MDEQSNYTCFPTDLFVLKCATTVLGSHQWNPPSELQVEVKASLPVASLILENHGILPPFDAGKSQDS